MTYILYGHCVVDCDDGRITTSPSASYRLHKKHDVLNPYLRTQNMVVSLGILVLQRMPQRFWQTLALSHACISWLLPVLFRFVCTFFCCLNTVFLLFVSLLHRVFDDTCCSTHCNKTYNDLCVRQSFENVWETRLEVLFDDTTYTACWTWNFPSRSRRSLTC